MKSSVSSFLILAGVLGIFTSLQAGGETLTGTVSAVQAGDLLTVQANGVQKEIRLYGIDCPEPGQPFADKAKDYITQKALNKEASIEVKATDSAGKTVGVAVCEYVNLNQSLLEAGLAWWDSQNTPSDSAFKALNAKAIVGKAGLWSDAAPLAPWDYRQGKGAQKATYTLEAKAEAPVPVAEKKEEPKVLAAKGNEVYTGGGKVINVADIKFDQKLTEQDGWALLSTHMPTVAKDASGKPIGLAVPNINEIPYANMLGFQDGDIISGVNGEPITDFSQVMPMIEKYKNSKQVNVQIMRNGQPTNVTFNIP
ncbi:MAG TPA: thermonuclease family protein [Candidatus Hydrogenedentes bacterium]|nr:thermonuclease family protein [Candidatus Hydrogenedentota bacterium]